LSAVKDCYHYLKKFLEALKNFVISQKVNMCRCKRCGRNGTDSNDYILNLVVTDWKFLALQFVQYTDRYLQINMYTLILYALVLV